jgi:hypothetical protein
MYKYDVERGTRTWFIDKVKPEAIRCPKRAPGEEGFAEPLVFRNICLNYEEFLAIYGQYRSWLGLAVYHRGPLDLTSLKGPIV